MLIWIDFGWSPLILVSIVILAIFIYSSITIAIKGEISYEDYRQRKGSVKP